MSRAPRPAGVGRVVPDAARPVRPADGRHDARAEELPVGGRGGTADAAARQLVQRRPGLDLHVRDGP